MDLKSKTSIPSVPERHVNSVSDECSSSTFHHERNILEMNNHPGYQPSAYSKSNSSFLIEDILFQRPKVRNIKVFSRYFKKIMLINYYSLMIFIYMNRNRF